MLADVALAELLLHPEQASRLLLGELEDRDAGGGGEHLGDDLLVHLGHHVEVAGLPLRLTLGPGAEQLLLVVAETRGTLEVLGVDGGFLLQPDGRHLLVELAQVRRRRHPTDPQPGAGLVDQVDRLVRQEPVGDVAVGHLRSGHQRLIGDGDPVVRLVAVAQATQDVDRVRDRRLGHLDRLEPALEGRVLLDVLAVLVEGGRADGLQLTTGQHRLQDAGGVDGALGGTRTHQGVDLVDEQDHVTTGADLLQHLLQALLEVAAVARTRHQRAEVEGVDVLVAQRLGHVAADDGLRKALDHGRLSDAGLPDQNRIVLRTSGKNGHHPFDLGFPADDRIELVLPRRLGQVATELVEHHRRGRGTAGVGSTGGRRFLALESAEQLQNLVPDAIEIGAQLHQDLCGDAFTLANQTEQDVFGADVGVVDLQCLAQAQLEHLLGARGEGDVTAGALLTVADDLLDLLPHRFQRNAERFQGLRRDTLALVDEAEENVFGADVVVVQHPSLFLGQHDHSTGSVGKPFEHVIAPRWRHRAAPR